MGWPLRLMHTELSSGPACSWTLRRRLQCRPQYSSRLTPRPTTPSTRSVRLRLHPRLLAFTLLTMRQGESITIERVRQQDRISIPKPSPMLCCRINLHRKPRDRTLPDKQYCAPSVTPLPLAEHQYTWLPQSDIRFQAADKFGSFL